MQNTPRLSLATASVAVNVRSSFVAQRAVGLHVLDAWVLSSDAKCNPRRH
jgi:hypothetical protein